MKFRAAKLNTEYGKNNSNQGQFKHGYTYLNGMLTLLKFAVKTK